MIEIIDYSYSCIDRKQKDAHVLTKRTNEGWGGKAAWRWALSSGEACRKMATEAR